MPRPNRYHPYTRNTQVPSPRYPPAPSLSRLTPSLPIVAEQPPARPYQCIFPGYIKGAMTSDGKTLAARSVFQSPDGILHVQMQVVRYPSEHAKLYSSPDTQQYASAVPSPPMLASQIDPAPAGFGGLDIQKTQLDDRKGSDSTYASQDGRSPRSMIEECAVVTDDEDAEGDIEDNVEDERWRALMEQRAKIGGYVQGHDGLGFGP